MIARLRGWHPQTPPGRLAGRRGSHRSHRTATEKSWTSTWALRALGTWAAGSFESHRSGTLAAMTCLTLIPTQKMVLAQLAAGHVPGQGDSRGVPAVGLGDAGKLRADGHWLGACRGVTVGDSHHLIIGFRGEGRTKAVLLDPESCASLQRWGQRSSPNADPAA